MSIKKNFKFRIRSTITQYVNGQRFVSPGKSVQFVNGTLRTHDPEVIYELNRALDSHPSFRRLFVRAPSADTMEKIQKIRADAHQKEQEIIKKNVSKEGVDDLQSFDKFLARHKAMRAAQNLRTTASAVSAGGK